MTANQERIRTFAILDLEVNGSPQYQFNKCSIIELCIYGISANHLQHDIRKHGREMKKPPKLPRVLNRINLMINPQSRIHDNTRTGLDNYMLENEAPMDDDTATCIISFLNRLEKPVCLVAHNGLDHDFRILNHVFQKYNMMFPSSLYCLDSLDGFRKMDKILDGLAKQYPVKSKAKSTINDDDPIDWQTKNETTPSRRKTICTDQPESDNKCNNKPYRSYKLGKMYESVFTDAVSEKLHEAESDVRHLTELILHYGKEFLLYAEDNKQKFDQVRQLGEEYTTRRYPKPACRRKLKL